MLPRPHLGSDLPVPRRAAPMVPSMTHACFTKVLGTRRGSKERRAERRSEDAVVDVVRVRSDVERLAGCHGLAPSQVETALKTAEPYLRVRQDDTTGRWYPDALAR